jgi:protein TonB
MAMVTAHVAPNPNRVFEEADVDTIVGIGPKTASPVYPARLKALGMEGQVVLEFVVDSSGRAEPESIRATSSSDPAFTDAAAATVRSSRYRPAANNGRHVRQRTAQPFSFHLNR